MLESRREQLLFCCLLPLEETMRGGGGRTIVPDTAASADSAVRSVRSAILERIPVPKEEFRWIQRKVA